MIEDDLEKLPFGIADLPSEPLGDLAQQMSPFDLAAFRHRLAARGSDAVERIDSAPVAPPAWTGSAALSLAPAAGISDALGLLPDLEKGGVHPGLVANLLNGEVGAAGWQALGALGDLTYLAGPEFGSTAGTLLKSGRALQHAQRAERLLSHAPRRDDILQADLRRYDPPRGVRERTFKLVRNQEVRDALLKKIEEGRAAGEEWYNTEPLRQEFIKVLGEGEGQAAYEKFLSFVAAASPMSNIGESIRNASYYFNRWRRGEGLPAVGDVNPNPYGHRYKEVHQRLARLVAGEGFDRFRHAKVLSFLANLRGNYRPVTVDMHAFRLPAILSKDPDFLKPEIRKLVVQQKLTIDDALKDVRNLQPLGRNEYAAIEQLYKEVAEKLGLEPAQAQAAAWVAGGDMTGLKSNKLNSFMEFFEQRLRKTADEKGITWDEVLREFIQGKMDLTSLDASLNPVA